MSRAAAVLIPPGIAVRPVQDLLTEALHTPLAGADGDSSQAVLVSLSEGIAYLRPHDPACSRLPASL